MANGNYRSSCCGHGSGQRYAWDLNAASGARILAARGGRVLVACDDETRSCWPRPRLGPHCASCFFEWPPGEVCIRGIGNHMWLEHQDGTFGIYFHQLVNGVIPERGIRVRRGAFVGLVGNTGCSAGPHLHFEVVTCTKLPPGKPECESRPARFEAPSLRFKRLTQ